jgi:hypothetical protein
MLIGSMSTVLSLPIGVAMLVRVPLTCRQSRAYSSAAQDL